MRTIHTIGIAGAGTMGSALAQKFAQEGFRVILADREMKFVEKGLSGIKKTLEEGLAKKVFSNGQVNGFLSNLQGTDDLNDLKSCGIIIEAIYEDFQEKCKLFKSISEIVPAETILATNTSSFSVTELSACVKHPERFIGLHYFYHAAKNRLVEIIPGEKTSRYTVEAVRRFSFLSGKDAISSKDRHGFIVNRFFVPWLNEAVRLHQENKSIPSIESTCKEVFGIGMGPFELMNVTGVPVAYHAGKTLERFGSLYRVAEALKKKAEEKQLWDLGEESNANPDIIRLSSGESIRERMLGITFFICSQLLDEKVCSASEIDRGAKIGLKWRKGPVELMRDLGIEQTTKLITGIADLYKMQLPGSIGARFWFPENVTVEFRNSIAIITLNQPESLNMLSEETMKQLSECFDRAEGNEKVKTIFITGSGKAFMAGADIRFFIKKMENARIGEIEEFTKFGQKVFEKIECSEKKVVAVINGLALGGGLELALCADIILALPKAQMAFPETGIGIYPGLGGTQRTAQRIGKGLAKYLILTGKMLSAIEAEEIRLVDRIISANDFFDILDGEKEIPQVTHREVPMRWKSIADLYSKNKFQSIIKGNCSCSDMQKNEIDQLGKTMSFKAPLAMQVAEELIESAKGPASELEKLSAIFSTGDALKGLTHIGQKVQYEGK